MRRSRKKGQLRRVYSIAPGSHTADENRGLRARLRDHAAERIAHERVSEELEAVGAGLRLEAHAIHRRDVDAVRDRVRALRRAPRVGLRRAPLLLLLRVPADRRRKKEHLRAHERRDARRLGIPLVPADQHADRRDLRLEHAKAATAACDSSCW